MDSPYWKGPLPGVDVRRRLPGENVPGPSRTGFRGQPKSVRLQPGIGVRLHPGMLFGISPKSCSASPRNAVRLAPEYALDPTFGHEQRGVRPCIVVSDPDVISDQRFPLVCVVPVTGTAGEGLLYPALAPGNSGLAKRSFALI